MPTKLYTIIYELFNKWRGQDPNIELDLFEYNEIIMIFWAIDGLIDPFRNKFSIL